MSALAEIAVVLSGVAPEPPRADPVSFIQIKDLTPDRRSLVQGERPRVARASPVREGDVLVAGRGERVPAIVADEELLGAYIALDLYLVRPDTNFLDPDYLAAFLSLPQTVAKLRASASQSLLPRVPKDALDQLDIPMAPLDRQRLIGGLARTQRIHSALLDRLAVLHTRLADLTLARAFHTLP